MSGNAVAALLSNMPPGIRFQPTDEEIFSYYLRNKILGNISECDDIIAEVDYYKFDPENLISKSKILSKDKVCWFYSLPDYKYANSKRSNRRTETGYWKITGPGRKIMGCNGCIGLKKILVHHAAGGKRTGWVTHEHSVQPDSAFPNQRVYVLCRLEKKKDEKGQKAETSEESQQQSGEISSDAENPVAPAETAEVHGSQSSMEPLDWLEHFDLDEEMHSPLSSFVIFDKMPASCGADKSKVNNYGETMDDLFNPVAPTETPEVHGSQSSMEPLDWLKHFAMAEEMHSPLSSSVIFDKMPASCGADKSKVNNYGETMDDLFNPVAPAETPEGHGSQSSMEPLDWLKQFAMDEEMHSLLSSFVIFDKMPASCGADTSKVNNYGETMEDLFNESGLQASLKRKFGPDGTVNSHEDHERVNERVKQYRPLATGDSSSQ